MNRKYYLLLLIPLTLALLSPRLGARKNNSDDVSNSKESGGEWYNNYNSESITNPEEIDYDKIINQSNGDYENGYMYDEAENFLKSKNIEGTQKGPLKTIEDILKEKSDEDLSAKYEKYAVNGIIVINDSVFPDWYFDVQENPEDFLGKRYQYLAQVFPFDGLEKDQFLAGRSFMICNENNLEDYGILCESNIRSQLKADQWITVTGTIDKYEYEGNMLPKLTDATVTESKAPEVEYIHYNSN